MRAKGCGFGSPSGDTSIEFDEMNSTSTNIQTPPQETPRPLPSTPAATETGRSPARLSTPLAVARHRCREEPGSRGAVPARGAPPPTPSPPRAGLQREEPRRLHHLHRPKPPRRSPDAGVFPKFPRPSPSASPGADVHHFRE